MENSTPLCNGKRSNADMVQDSETSLLVSKKGNKNDLVDSEKTPQSCVDVVFELLASTAGTSSLNSLLNHFGFFSLSYKLKGISHLCCGKKPKD